MHYMLVLWALALPSGLSVDNTVPFERGVEYIGASLPTEATLGQTFTAELYYKADRPFDENVFHFLHVEGDAPGSSCRVVYDTRAPAPERGLVKIEVEVKLSSDAKACKGSKNMTLFGGFYNRKTGVRYEIEGELSNDSRMNLAWVGLVGEDPDTSPRVINAGDLWWHRFWSRLAPWWGWILGLTLSIAAAVVLSFTARWLARSRGELGELWAPKTGQISSWKHPVFWISVGVLTIAFALSIFAGLDFIKDDAYISFRYTHNLIHGHGLVFNTGERVEGFTNFLWVILMVPFEALGMDLFQVSEVVGVLAGLGMLALLVKLDLRFDGARFDLSHLWAAMWLATSSSAARWLTSGMEQPLAMLLPLASAYALWTAREAMSGKRAAVSGALIALACMTRPELHMIGIILGVPLLWGALRTRAVDVVTRNWFAALLGLTVPFHLFRVLYFRDLFPNTFYVKTGASESIVFEGLKKLLEMFEFNLLGVLLLLVPFAFLDRRHRAEKLQALAIALGFMLFVVRVGVDEMKWHRLYLPGLPFLCWLAGQGAKNLCRALVRLMRVRVATWGVYGVAWLVVAGAVYSNINHTQAQMRGFNGRGDLSGAFHPDIGKFVTRHDRPGAWVAFQDMGSTPYHAPDINFLDFIGLVDHTVAHARYEYGLHAFTNTSGMRNQPKFDSDMRDYFYERSPEWVILTSYIPGNQAGRVMKRFNKRQGPKALEPWIGTNAYQFGIYKQRFKDSYAHVRTWPRSSTYYLSLFRRRDLWEKTPGEVVLDAAPAGIKGVKATFEGGLELLGSEIDGETIERHEAFFTTWWRLPGPMPEDTVIFVHVHRPDYQTPYDHLPGDWMYPADRWSAGEILEDRVLFQLPWNMPVGEYTVSMGVYRRSTGERLQIIEGPNDGQNRLTLGTLKVGPLRPPLHHLIPPTDVDVMRRYPDRIIDHGRPSE